MTVFARALALSSICFTLALATPDIASAAALSAKKGVGMWSFGGDEAALVNVGASWFYTWATTNGGITAPPGVSFVPMLWGSGSVDTKDIDTVKGEGTVLLGFNEPDNGGQSNMTPAQALALWPQLVATGMRLGSPAVAANAPKSGGWLDQFMTGAAQKNLRVDFICLHWYGGAFDTNAAVSGLQSYIQQTHDKYNLPIWLTEYALTNYSGSPMYPTLDQQVAFASASVAMLESTSYVERYAWFALSPCTSNCTAADNKYLSTFDGGLTAVGVAYAGTSDDGGTQASDATSSADVSSGADSALGSGSSSSSGGPASLDGASSTAEAGFPPLGSGPSDAGSPDAGGSGSKSGCQCTLTGERAGEHGRAPAGAPAVACGLLAFSVARRRRGSKR